MSRKHNYSAFIKWTGNTGEGTVNYRSYERSYTVAIKNKPELSGSSDPTFRGDSTRYNPEDMLLAALSACHMLSYLHVCAVEGITVLDYEDNAFGTMITDTNGSGHFTEVTLNPVVTVSETTMLEKANLLHKKANELCFIANSVNFPVHHLPKSKLKEKDK